MSRFRAFTRKCSSQEIEKARARTKKEAELRFLDDLSVYNHEKNWKQARKRGNTKWIFNDEGYRQWKEEKKSSLLWCTGILGSGKTAFLSANVVEDLLPTSPTPPVVAYIFCRYDEAETLETRTIMGSIARQILEHIKSGITDSISKMRHDNLDTDQILDYLQMLLPIHTHKYFIVIDGLDECKEKERRLLLQCLKRLLKSKHVFRVYCASRSDVAQWAHTLTMERVHVSDKH